LHARRLSLPVRALPVLRPFPTRRSSDLAVRLGVIPKTMKGKEFLKRVFFGRLAPVPPELTNGAGTFEVPVPVGRGVSVRDFKVRSEEHTSELQSPDHPVCPLRVEDT